MVFVHLDALLAMEVREALQVNFQESGGMVDKQLALYLVYPVTPGTFQKVLVSVVFHLGPGHGPYAHSPFHPWKN